MRLDLADALRRHLLQRFPADRDYPRAALHAAGMPPLVATFLERALDRWLEIERDQLRSEWFDFDDPTVQEAEARFFDTLAKTARVPAEAWKATLGGAVDLVVRFLTIPARALTDALFEGDSEPLPTPEIRRRLRLFAAYLYFPEVAAAYLDKKQPDTLDPATLYDLLDRIDRRIVVEYRPDDWLALLAPLFALARTVPAFDGVPASLLVRFFRAKGYDAVADRLEPLSGTTVDEPALRRILVEEIGEPEIVPPSTPEIAPPREPEIAPVRAPEIEEPPVEEPEIEERPSDTPEIAPPSRTPEVPPPDAPEEDVPEVEDPEPDEPEIEEPPAEDTDEPEAEVPPHDEPRTTDHGPNQVPLWQRFARDPAPADPEDEEDDAPAPLWQRFSSGASPGPPPAPRLPAPAPTAALPERAASAPAPRTDTLDALEARVLGPTPPSKRARFVKHLFRSDAGKYATVLHALDAAGSWTEASQIIARDVFRPFKVNIYGEHAVDFTDAVESRFRR
jgi:hypothetical protein